MSLVEVTVPVGRPFTYADLEALPDDGTHYEIFDGLLVVSPSPTRPHQRASVRLTVLLDAACPPGFEMLAAPFDVVLADTMVLQPDLIVGRDTDFTERNLPVAPVLAVEILSPSTRRYDQLMKRAAFEDHGVPSYWIVDPETPSLLVLELAGGVYAEVAHVTGDEVFEATRPFPVRVCPAELVTPR